MTTRSTKILIGCLAGAALLLVGAVALYPASMPVVTPAAAQRDALNLDVPYVPTPMETVERMLAMAKVGPNDYLIDLGSGDGRIPIAAARKFGTHGMGVDLNPARIAESNANAKEAGVTDKVEFRNQDLFDTDISKATVLTMYLLPDVNMKLRPRIWRDLKPGTRIVSHAFSMGDWIPDASSQAPDGRNNVYLWIVPEPGVAPRGVRK